MMTSVQAGDQALNPSPSEAILPSSLDTTEVTLRHAHFDLLRGEPMLTDPLEPLRTDFPEQDSTQPHSGNDKQEQDSLATLKESLQDVEGKQTASIPDQEEGSSWKSYAIKAGIIGAGAVAAPFIVTAGLGALGFTAAGITAGSAAAGLMSTYGGTVAVGSICAVMQSIGAAGLSAAGTVIASTVGGAVVGAGVKVLSNGNDDDDDDGEEEEKVDEL